MTQLNIVEMYDDCER